jgi:hypothetical protein
MEFSAGDTAANMAIRTGVTILAVPDPLPVVDEVIGVTLIAGGLIYHLASNLPYGGVSSYPSQSVVTSTTGHSVRTPAKKQMRSTSRSSYSRRRNYYYGKKRKY